ncbi:potassium channel family protein [Hyphobacterium sp. SN044]|uniref:potassium channel family protein n=1 Tax=Hyphobacterium sp. SN044 TaxID=2912575 RepID=UPI001F1E70F2|nr:potassium channel family protein [Hyphobacterium sp. SN044]MCF8878759.1 potassium channel family protein [Hyphobacterium sp. SN044]
MIESDAVQLMPPLAVATGMIAGTVVIHMIGLIVLMALLQSRSHNLKPMQNALRQGIFIVLVVLGLVVIHAVEIWLYALVYRALGEFPTLEAALYFSTSSFTTVGYGDVVLDERWRLVGAIEGFNGLLLIGWSTAFLVSVIGKLRAAELAWLDRMRDS